MFSLLERHVLRQRVEHQDLDVVRELHNAVVAVDAVERAGLALVVAGHHDDCAVLLGLDALDLATATNATAGVSGGANSLPRAEEKRRAADGCTTVSEPGSISSSFSITISQRPSSWTDLTTASASLYVTLTAGMRHSTSASSCSRSRRKAQAARCAKGRAAWVAHRLGLLLRKRAGPPAAFCRRRHAATKGIIFLLRLLHRRLHRTTRRTPVA